MIKWRNGHLEAVIHLRKRLKICVHSPWWSTYKQHSMPIANICSSDTSNRRSGLDHDWAVIQTTVRFWFWSQTNSCLF